MKIKLKQFCIYPPPPQLYRWERLLCAASNDVGGHGDAAGIRLERLVVLQSLGAGRDPIPFDFQNSKK